MSLRLGIQDNNFEKSGIVPVPPQEWPSKSLNL